MILKHKLLMILSIFILHQNTAFSAIEDDVANLITRVTILETPIIENDTSAVYLKKNCGLSNNCFTTILDIQNWLDNRVAPTNAVAINIDPGTYAGFFNCNAGYNLSINGSGRTATLINGTLFTSENCNLNVQDIKISSFLFPVYASAVGNITTWTNVELAGEAYGWQENTCEALTAPEIERSKHYFFSSRIVTGTDNSSNNARAYVSCSENWFFGSEITAIGGPNSKEVAGLVLHNSETHVYGSVIRVISEPGAFPEAAGPTSNDTTVKGIVAVSAAKFSDVHIHGTGIDVISHEANDTIALLVRDEISKMHVIESAFSLSTGSGGKTTRISNANNSPHVHASYTWPSAVEPPSVVSISGYDSFIETDCNSSGVCVDVIASEQQPHQMIYSHNCSGSNPWFDTVTNACRK